MPRRRTRSVTIDLEAAGGGYKVLRGSPEHEYYDAPFARPGLGGGTISFEEAARRGLLGREYSGRGIPAPAAIGAARRAGGLVHKGVHGAGEAVGGGLRLAESFFTEAPPPGMVGYWTGKGTRADPRHFHGVPERFAGYALLAGLLVWGLEQLEVDISNWWANSPFNVGADLTSLGQKLGASVMASLGFPVSTDAQGNVTSVGARKSLPFLDWVGNQIVPTGTAITSWAASIDSLALTTPPPGAPIPQPPPGGGQLSTGNSSFPPGTFLPQAGASPCQPGFTLMSAYADIFGGFTAWACVRNDYVWWAQANGYTAFVPTIGTGTPGGHGIPPPHHGKSP